MTQDKVVAVLGPATSGAFKATIPEAIKNKVLPKNEYVLTALIDG